MPSHSQLEKFVHFIHGRPESSENEATFVTTNPTTGAAWGRFAEGSLGDIDRAVASARQAGKGAWADLSPTRRGRLMMRWGDLLAEHAEAIARLESTQNGKLYRDSFGQAKGFADWLYYYGGLADKVQGEVIPLERRSILNYTLREPLGVVAVITPWNSPASLTLAAVAPALAAGNTVVVKPSEIASASVLKLAELAVEAGLPPGVVNVVTGGRGAGEALIAHADVAKIAFTGSVAAGRAIAATAGGRIVPCTLELGGKSPNIVFPDADLRRAEAGVLGGIFSSSGQTCVAGSRVYVHQAIYRSFVDRLVSRAEAIRIGDPFLPETQMGPVTTADQLAKDMDSVAAAKKNGARILTGGEQVRPDGLGGGYYFQPTILGDLDRSNPALATEIFGPVLTVVPFKDEDEAVELANDSRFGLAAGFWTLDARRVQRMAQRLEAGNVWINMYRAFAFASPFAGYKESGLGTQNGLSAIEQYLRTKSVWSESTDTVEDAFLP